MRRSAPPLVPKAVIRHRFRPGCNVRFLMIVVPLRTERQVSVVPRSVSNFVLYWLAKVTGNLDILTFAQAKTYGRYTKIFSSTSAGVFSARGSKVVSYRNDLPRLFHAPVPDSKEHHIANAFSPDSGGYPATIESLSKSSLEMTTIHLAKSHIVARKWRFLPSARSTQRFITWHSLD
jgi:hypothetical protein